MGCRNQWADDTHLIMDIYIEAPWTWDEFMSLARQTFTTIQAEGKPCATTVDVTQIGAFPKGNVLGYLTQVEKMMPADVFASVIIGAPYMVTVFMEIMMRIRPRAQRIALFAKTHEEAREKVMERYAKLNTAVEKN